MKKNYTSISGPAVYLPAALQSENYLKSYDLVVTKRFRKDSVDAKSAEYVILYYAAGYWFTEN